MATIVSAQGGNWEDTTTWVGGVVPSSTDDVVIASGHTVTYNTETVHAAKVTLQGTLNIASGIEFKFGARNGVSAHLYFDGGTLGGQGAILINKGSCTTNPEKWSYVKDSVSLAASASSYQDNCTWDLEKLSYTSSGAFTPQFKVDSSGGGNGTFRMYDCVIEGASTLNLGAVGSHIPKGITLEKVTIIDTPIYAQGSGSSAKPTIFNNCVLIGFSLRLMISNSYTTFNNCFFKASIYTAGYGVTFNNCFMTNETTTEGNFYLGTSSNPNSTINNCIVYCPSSSATNTRAAEIAHVTDCYFEDDSRGDGNGFIGGATHNFPYTFTNNVCVGAVSFFTAQQATAFPFDYTVTGNTVYAVNGSAAATLMAFESVVPANGSAIKIKNNLSCRNGVANDVLYVIKYGEAPFAQTIDIDFDYNAAYNQDWYRTDGLISNSSGTHLLANTDPKFKDPTRNIASWALIAIGASDYDSILAYFGGMLGYDATTSTHSGTPLSSTIITDTRDWLKEGYTPTNMALATAGEGGTFVGALAPQEIIIVTANISLKANANTVTIGDNVTYTLTLSEALSEELLVTVSIGNVNRSTTISANALEGYITFTTASVGNLVAQIKSTDNGNVTITGPIVNVVVNDVAPPPPQGKFFRPLEVATVDESHVNLTVPSGVTGELQITLTYTKG